MNNNFYRYEFVKDNQRDGILTGLDKYFSIDEICSVCGIFEISLKAPNINMTNTKSYFTERGNRKFRKMIRNIKKIAETKGIITECIIKENLDNIIYTDNYQVIISTETQK